MIMQNNKRKQQVLADMLPHLVRDRGWVEQLDLHSIFQDWPRLVDSETGEHCRPLKISRGVLWIEVDSSAWLQQLQFQKQHLFDTLNASLRKSMLKDIKLTLSKGNTAKRPAQEPVLRFIPPPAEDVAAFERQIAFITDEQCREALLRFWYLAHACRRG